MPPLQFCENELLLAGGKVVPIMNHRFKESSGKVLENVVVVYHSSCLFQLERRREHSGPLSLPNQADGDVAWSL